nr:hypothetical protein [Deinococcus yavapaiensis]
MPQAEHKRLQRFQPAPFNLRAPRSKISGLRVEQSTYEGPGEGSKLVQGGKGRQDHVQHTPLVDVEFRPGFHEVPRERSRTATNQIAFGQYVLVESPSWLGPATNGRVLPGIPQRLKFSPKQLGVATPFRPASSEMWLEHVKRTRSFASPRHARRVLCAYGCVNGWACDAKGSSDATDRHSFALQRADLVILRSSSLGVRVTPDVVDARAANLRQLQTGLDEDVRDGLLLSGPLPFDGFPEVLEDVPSVEHLPSLRRTRRNGNEILFPTITGDEFDVRTSLEPCCYRRSIAIGKKVDGRARFEVDDHRAVREALSEGEVVDADEVRTRTFGTRKGMNQSQQTIGGNEQARRGQQSRARFCADVECHAFEHGAQPLRDPFEGCDELREGFGERLLRTGDVVTSKAPNDQAQRDGDTEARQILYEARGAAVKPEADSSARGANASTSTTGEGQRERRVTLLDFDELEVKLRWEQGVEVERHASQSSTFS